MIKAIFNLFRPKRPIIQGLTFVGPVKILQPIDGLSLYHNTFMPDENGEFGVKVLTSNTQV